MTPQAGSASGSMLIDGKLVAATGGETFENINPATEEIIGEVPDAQEADVDEAIAAARRAFDETDWSVNHEFRLRCLEQLQAALESEREEFRGELVAEGGTPIVLTYSAQLDAPLEDAIRWPIKALTSFEWERDLGDAVPMGMPTHRLVRKEAVGVVAGITPWNFPFEVEITKLAQALATGNTFVLKPAPDTPAHALRMARLITEQTDIPDGVVNIVTPSDHRRGEQLVTDPRVDCVSFTGSTAVGQRITELGAPTFKRVFLELGGKSAHIVLEDADLEAAVGMAAFVCVHAGQGCGMMTRLLVPRSRYADAIDIVAAGFASIAVGDPTDPSTICGPVINEKQRDRVIGYVESGKAEGARVAYGGSGRAPGFDRGWFVEPTLFVDVDNGMRIAQEEIFGPVLVVIPFEDDDDAVRIANDSRYGLAGAVTGGSLDRAMDVARRIRTGAIGVNGGSFYSADLPYGGYKASGIGRQNGVEGFEQYLETKAIGYGIAP